MKYIAKTGGFVGGVRIRKGDTFEFEGKPGKWMKPADAVKPTKPGKEAKEPTTFSEIAKIDGKAQGHKNGNAA